MAPVPAPERLICTRAMLRALRASAETALPDECCGILAGRAEERCWEVREFVPLANLGGPGTFAVAPAEFAREESRLRSRGLRLLGFAHSHPGGGAEPSAADLFHAWRGHVMGIVPVTAGRSGLPAFWWPDDTGARPLPWE